MLFSATLPFALYWFNIEGSWYLQVNSIYPWVCEGSIYLGERIMLSNRDHPVRKHKDVRSLKHIQCDVLEADLIGVNIDRECTDVNLVVHHMMCHFQLYWINMHLQNTFMLLKDL